MAGLGWVQGVGLIGWLGLQDPREHQPHAARTGTKRTLLSGFLKKSILKRFRKTELSCGWPIFEAAYTNGFITRKNGGSAID